jgi:hypothetical protein
MPLILHIFRKDARRLWKEIAGTLALLAWLTQLDSWRGGYTPGVTEGWLNLLLPLAWGCLAALAVLQDPVPGERQFWLTLPCPRGRWIAAKTLFLVAFIHLPYLVSNIVVLSARGFAPWQFTTRLLQQQLLLLFAVTLPCTALASVLRNAMQFIVALIGILSVVVVFAGSAGPGQSLFQPVPWVQTDHVRQWMCLAALACLAAFIAVSQYGLRRTRRAQLAGVSGMLATAALFVWWSPAFSAAMELAMVPRAMRAQPVTVTSPPRQPWSNAFARNGVSVAIPIALTGAPPAKEAQLRQISFELVEPNGTRHPATQYNPRLQGSQLIASLWDADWEMLTLDRPLFNRLRNVPVVLHGYLTIQRLADRGAKEIPAHRSVDLPALGKCFQAETNGDIFRDKGLRIVCESPTQIGENRVILSDTNSAHTWEHRLGEAYSPGSYPAITWLSPVDRKETYFSVNAAQQFSAGAGWIIPGDVMGHYRVGVIPRPVISQTNTDFRLTGIRLGQYMVKPVPQAR